MQSYPKSLAKRIKKIMPLKLSKFWALSTKIFNTKPRFQTFSKSLKNNPKTPKNHINCTVFSLFDDGKTRIGTMHKTRDLSHNKTKKHTYHKKQKNRYKFKNLNLFNFQKNQKNTKKLKFGA